MWFRNFSTLEFVSWQIHCLMPHLWSREPRVHLCLLAVAGSCAGRIGRRTTTAKTSRNCCIWSMAAVSLKTKVIPSRRGGVRHSLPPTLHCRLAIFIVWSSLRLPPLKVVSRSEANESGITNVCHGILKCQAACSWTSRASKPTAECTEHVDYALHSRRYPFPANTVHPRT